MNIKIAQFIPQGVIQIIQSTTEFLLFAVEILPSLGWKHRKYGWAERNAVQQKRRNKQQIQQGKPLIL